MRVTFHAVAAGGDAVGRDENGRVVFAPYAAPGDVAEVTVEEERRSFVRGRLLQIETASPQRTTAPCPYYLPTADYDPATACGGCQIQHLDYAAQPEAKQRIVVDALQRIARIDNPVVRDCLPSPQPFHYRNKADLVVGVENGAPQIGYFARGSHNLIDIATCPIQQQPNNELLEAVRAALESEVAPPFDAATGRGVLRRVVARTASNGETLLTAVTTAESWPGAERFCEFLFETLPSLVGVLRREPRQAPRVVAGRDWLTETVLGLKLRVTGEGFFQVNTGLTSALVETSLRYAAVEAGQRVVDLFCGVGLFALAAAQQGARVQGIEVSRGAVRDAEINARQNELQAEFSAADAVAGLKKVSAADTVILDPPREGAAAAIPELLRLKPHRIVYISCDPATLARDLKMLCAGGYTLREATPLDMFPQTAHVETVALLQI